MQGWVRLHRKIRNNPVFNDLSLFRLWIICLTEAYHKPAEKFIGKQLIKLEQGQFITGRFDLQKMYNNGLSKKDQVKDTTLWNWLKLLKNSGFIDIDSNNKFTIVTVINWGIYQRKDNEVDNNCDNRLTTESQQIDTNNNVNNVLHENLLKHMSAPDSADVSPDGAQSKKAGKGHKTSAEKSGKDYSLDFERFWACYPRRIEKKGAYAKWNARLKDHDPSYLIQCATNYKDYCAINKIESQYIKHPATFLSDKEPFKDYEAPLINLVPNNPISDQKQSFREIEAELNRRALQ